MWRVVSDSSQTQRGPRKRSGPHLMVETQQKIQQQVLHTYARSWHPSCVLVALLGAFGIRGEVRVMGMSTVKAR